MYNLFRLLRLDSSATNPDLNAIFLEQIQSLTADYTQQTVLYNVGGVIWDFNNGGYIKLTLTGNAVIANPINPVDGKSYIIELIQDVVGSRTVTWGSNFVWSGGIAPTLTTTAGSRDFITLIASNGKLYAVATPNFV